MSCTETILVSYCVSLHRHAMFSFCPIKSLHTIHRDNSQCLMCRVMNGVYLINGELLMNGDNGDAYRVGIFLPRIYPLPFALKYP